MGAVYSEESKYSKLKAEWERSHRPYVFQKFPQMVYRARRSERIGKITVNDPGDLGFSKSCQHICRDEAELQRFLSDGWKENPTEAIERAEAEERRVAEAAANREWNDAHLSERARAEAKAKDAALTDGISHVAEIPESRLDKSQPVAVLQCQGKTAKGEQCKFKSLSGSLFCKKHS